MSKIKLEIELLATVRRLIKCPTMNSIHPVVLPLSLDVTGVIRCSAGKWITDGLPWDIGYLTDEGMKAALDTIQLVVDTINKENGK